MSAGHGLFVVWLSHYIGDKKVPRLLADVLIFGMVVFIAILVWKGNSAADKAFRRADKAACIRIELLKSVARAQLNRSLTTLPTLAYYKEHPVELVDAQQQTLEYLKKFKPIKC